VQSRRPLASLIFAAPLLVAYEAGVVLLHQHAVRNGADAWMRQWLDALGFGQYFLLPVLCVFILLGWHHLSRQPWRVSIPVLYGMAGECVLLAFCLRMLLRLQAILMQTIAGALRLSIRGTLGTVTAYLGAGVYEELLFRLILLTLGIGLLRWLRLGPRASIVGGALASSLLFAIAHYVGAYGDHFGWFTFLFRFLAGMFFSALFLTRGFGIAAGTHAAYDVLVGLAAGR
jgi:membrane protease YdiL (CAAX protease family)